MRIQYQLEENDFLDFQMFTAFQSERILKKKKIGWALLTVGSLLLALHFHLNDNRVLTAYFGVTSVIFAIFYPKYFKWRYKQHYKTFIKENYSKRFGQIETLDFKDGYIFYADKTGEGKLNISEVEKVDETQNHFFMKLSTGQSLIIPKNQINYLSELRDEFSSLALAIHDHTN